MLYDYFKEPSSVTVRDVDSIIVSGENGEESILAYTYYMTLAGENGFGGNTVDRYYVSRENIYLADTYKDYLIIRSEDIENIDLTKINKALKEYFEEKGW